MQDDLERLFSPRRVAVVASFGGRTDGGSIIVDNLRRAEDVDVMPVATRDAMPEGAVRSLRDAGPIDVAVLYVPAEQVPGLITDAGGLGCAVVIVESAGFAEAHEAGTDLQREAVEAARVAGVRLLGPNCSGVLNGARNLATAPVPMHGIRAGHASLLVQSGVMAGAVLAQVMNLGTFGAAKVCSLGNKADLDESELLEYLGEDPDTRAVGLYLEWVSRPDEFIAVGGRVAKQKPVVALVGGRSGAGEALTRRHTARPAGDARRTTEIVQAAGISCIRGFTEMLEVTNGLAVLSSFEPAGGRTAVITLSGSGAVVAVDAWQDSSLSLADLGARTVARLSPLFPGWLHPENPLDIWPAAAHHGMEVVVPEVLAALEEDEGIDLVLAILPVLSDEERTRLPQLLPRRTEAMRKPLVCWYYGGGSPEIAAEVEARGAVMASSIESAVSLLGQLALRVGR
jgi:acetate---CoA ligase (ADP-forming)